jgi:hypothetical protein
MDLRRTQNKKTANQYMRGRKKRVAGAFKENPCFFRPLMYWFAVFLFCVLLRSMSLYFAGSKLYFHMYSAQPKPIQCNSAQPTAIQSNQTEANTTHSNPIQYNANPTQPNAIHSNPTLAN